MTDHKLREEIYKLLKKHGNGYKLTEELILLFKKYHIESMIPNHLCQDEYELCEGCQKEK